MYNSSLQPNSYDSIIREANQVDAFIKGQHQYRYEHQHRRWEYGLAIALIKEVKPKSILNVGGGNSPLSRMAYKYCPYVTEIDPNVPDTKFPEIAYIDDEFPNPGLRGKFDLVLCTSVIEHVEHDHLFFRELLNIARGHVFLTTDFHPTGKQFSMAHLRTYNSSSLEYLMDIAYEHGFMPLGEPNYSYKVPMVYDYTFASLTLAKVYDV